MSVRMTGSGNVAIGIVQSDPDYMNGDLGKLLNGRELKIGIDVKLFKALRDICLSLGGGSEHDRVFLTSEIEKYSISIDPNKYTWLVVYIQYGDVTVEIGKYHTIQKFIQHDRTFFLLSMCSYI